MSISPMVSFWASSLFSFAFPVTQCIVLSLFVFCGKIKCKCKNVTLMFCNLLCRVQCRRCAKKADNASC